MQKAIAAQVCLAQPASSETTLEHILCVAVEAGFECVDLWASKLEDHLASHPTTLLDARLRSSNLYILAVSGLELVPTEATSLLAPQPREQDLMLEARAMELCTRLDALGGGTIVVRPGSLSGSGLAEKAKQALVRRALQRLSNLAAPFEVQIALEFDARAQSLIRTLETSIQMIDTVARPNVRLALSAWDLWLSGANPGALDLLDPWALVLVHLDHFGRASATPPPTTAWTVDEFIRAICARWTAQGFDGPYSVVPPPHQQLSPGLARQLHQEALEIVGSGRQ